MSFDAGSIESRLTVDRTDFQEGLAAADRQAREFSSKRISPVIDLDAERFKRSAADVTERVRRLGAEDARIAVHLETGEATAEILRLKAEIASISGKDVRISASGGGTGRDGSGFLSGGVGGPSNLLVGAVAGLPALIPVVATLTAGVGALSSMFTAAGVGAAGFALLAKPQLEAVSKAQTQLAAAQLQYDKATTNTGRATALRNEYLILAQLTPQQREYMTQLNGLKGVYKDLQASVSTQVFTVAGSALHALGGAGELLKPVFQAAGDTFVELARQFDTWISKSAGVRAFVDFLTRQTGPAIYTLVHSLADVARGFGGILMAFEPLLGSVEHGMSSFTSKFAAWGAGLGSSSGFQKFLDYVRTNAPTVGHMFSELGQAFGTIITQLAPFGPIGLRLITDLATLINQDPGLVKVAASLILVWKAVSLMSGAAGGITGVVKSFQNLTGLFAEGGGLAKIAPMLGGIGVAAAAFAPALAVAGLTLVDIGRASSSTSRFIDGLNASLKNTPGDAAAYTSAIDQVQAKMDSLSRSMGRNGGELGQIWSSFTGAFTGRTEMDVANALAGTGKKLADFKTQLQNQRAAVNATADDIAMHLTDLGKGTYFDNLKVATAGLSSGLLKMGLSWQDNLQILRTAPAAQSAVAKWLQVSGDNASTAAQKTQAYSDAINALSGANMGLLQSGDAAQKAVNDIGQAVSTTTHDLDGNTDAAIQNRSAIAGAVQPILDHVAAMNKSGKSTQQVTLYTLGMAKSLETSLVQLGFNKGAVDKLLQSLIQIPPSKATNVTVPGAAGADGTIRNLNRDLNNLPDHRTITIDAINNTASALSSIQQMIANIPRNIPITVSGYANLSKLTSPQFNANGNLYEAFAAGGFESHIAQIAKAGAMRVWAEPETGGEAYIPLAASKHARSVDIWRETGRKLGVSDGKQITQNFTYAGPLTPQVVSEARRQLDFAVGA